MVIEAVVACPEAKYCDLLLTIQQVVGIGSVEKWMLMIPLGLFLSLDNCFGLLVAS